MPSSRVARVHRKRSLGGRIGFLDNAAGCCGGFFFYGLRGFFQEGAIEEFCLLQNRAQRVAYIVRDNIRGHIKKRVRSPAYEASLHRCLREEGPIDGTFKNRPDGSCILLRGSNLSAQRKKAQLD